MSLLDPDELRRLLPAEAYTFPAPIPTQVVSSDEFMPPPQTRAQQQVEARIKALGDDLARRQGTTRRRFLQTASGMAAAFLAMNEVYGPLYDVSPAEAQTPELAKERATALSGQFVMDCHTHFLRDDTRLMTFVRQREAVGRAGWNPALAGKPQTIEDLKFANYFKEVFLDSDTKVALISGSPSDIPQDWFLTNEMKAEARERVNREAGTRRLLSHAIFTPGQPGWLEAVDRAIAELKPDSFKGYTIGDNTNKAAGKYPWRLDDEKVTYKAYEKFAQAGLVNVCIHKGLFPPSVEARFPHLLAHSDVRDVGRAAKDWPQLNFIIYHSAYRSAAGGSVQAAWSHFERTGRIEWVTDLSEIPARYGVTNVYGDLGQIFAQSTVAEPRLCAAMMGQLVRGLGTDHVVWGSDAVWTGSPQWQIEALRRLEIPGDMQRTHGFAPLGAADGPVKRMILGETNARLYRYDRRGAGLDTDRIAAARARYEQQGAARSNLRYGYVPRPSR
ncbi:MAG TPA: amidohydrolase family protein [Candidatus Limnocylindria bacterium]|nr:amidohydrolase family protein [Candidatus Limnocylindria bacterium]